MFLRKWEAPPTTTAKKQSISLLESLTWLRHRSVLGIFLGFFAYDYAWFVYINWLPGYLALERKFTPQEMGVYSAVPYLAMSVIILTSGGLSDWLVRQGWNEIKVRKGFIMLGLAIGCLVVPAGFVEDKMTAVWLLTIALCGIGIASPNTWTLTQAVCEKRVVGTVSGIQNWGGNVGGIIAPTLTGVIAQYSSFATALIVVGVVLVAGILAYWLLIEEKFVASA
jgi:MFS family permease